MRLLRPLSSATGQADRQVHGVLLSTCSPSSCRSSSSSLFSAFSWPLLDAVVQVEVELAPADAVAGELAGIGEVVSLTF